MIRLGRKRGNYFCIKIKFMSIRVILFLSILAIACNAPDKVEEKQQLNYPADADINNFKTYQHRDSLKIIDFITVVKNGKENEPQPSIFLYQDENDKIRIAVEKNSAWHTWEIFDASEDQYYADVRLENFDNKGHKELIITSSYGSRLQSTMGNEFYQDTDIWDLDNVRHYFHIQHGYHEDDKGRNGDNTYSKDCNLEIQIQPLSITVSKDKKFADLEVNADCFKNEKYPKSFRLVENEMVESTDSL